MDYCCTGLESRGDREAAWVACYNICMDYFKSILQDRITKRIEHADRCEEQTQFAHDVLEEIAAFLMRRNFISRPPPWPLEHLASNSRLKDTSVMELDTAMEAFLEIYEHMTKADKELALKSAVTRKRWIHMAGTEDPEEMADDHSDRWLANQDESRRVTDNDISEEKFVGAVGAVIDGPDGLLKVRGIKVEHKVIDDPERWSKPHKSHG